LEKTNERERQRAERGNFQVEREKTVVQKVLKEH
jgi:hypothetical protein